MTHRTGIRIAGTLFALFLAGCNNDGPAASVTLIDVDPLFAGIDPGASLQLTATFRGEPANVTWESEDESIVTVSPTGRVTGVSSGIAAVTAHMPGRPPRSATITVYTLQGTALESGVGVLLAAETDAEDIYRIFVPEGTTSLVITTRGGTGDVDLYVRRAQPPTQSVFQCAPFAGGNNETCTFNNPEPGTWYIMLHAWEEYEGVTLTATLTP